MTVQYCEEAERESEDTATDYAMLEAGVIKLSKSPWSSPLVPVRKKDGTIRLCVDYRRLNAVTVDDPYPMMT